jgi:hypothetical protein
MISLVLLSLFLGMAGAFTVPTPSYNMGPDSGFISHGVIKADQGFSGTFGTDTPQVTTTFAPVVVASLGSAAAANTTQIWSALSVATTLTKSATQINAGGQGDSTPDVARGISVTPSGSITGTCALTGTDISDAVITETLTWTGSSSTKYSLRAFKSITQFIIVTDSTKTFDIGYDDMLGMPEKLTTSFVLGAALAGTREGTAPTVTVSSATLSLNTIDLNSALNGGAVKVWYIRT